MKQFLLLLSLLTIFGCNQNQKKESPENEKVLIEPENEVVSPDMAFAQNIEAAHNKQAWEAKNVVSFNIDLSYGGKQALEATITSRTNSTKVRIDKKDGSKLIYNGKDVFLSPANAVDKGARFDMFTWQYFFALPFKLTDPGTNWKLLEPQKIDGNSFSRAQLTFGENIGDAPDDWYVVYQQPETGLLHAAAYIVTFGKTMAEAEVNPHAIVYLDYEEVEGIHMATKWTFNNWNEEKGIQDQIGEATISNIKFFDAKDSLFEQPEDSKLIEK